MWHLEKWFSVHFHFIYIYSTWFRSVQLGTNGDMCCAERWKIWKLTEIDTLIETSELIQTRVLVLWPICATSVHFIPRNTKHSLTCWLLAESIKYQTKPQISRPTSNSPKNVKPRAMKAQRCCVISFSFFFFGVYACVSMSLVEAGLVTPAVMATDVPHPRSSTQEAGIQAICLLNRPILPALSFYLSKISRPHLYPCHNGCGPQATELSQTHNHQPTNSTALTDWHNEHKHRLNYSVSLNCTLMPSFCFRNGNSRECFLILAVSLTQFRDTFQHGTLQIKAICRMFGIQMDGRAKRNVHASFLHWEP